MRSRRGLAVVAVAVAALGVLLVSRARAPSVTAGRTRAVYVFSCCERLAPVPTWRRGETVRLAWRASLEPLAGAASPSRVTLRASLSGPFPSVADLKARAARARPVVTAAPVETSTSDGRSPVLVLPLPPATRPGLYNLQTSSSSGGGTVRSETVVRVVG